MNELLDALAVFRLTQLVTVDEVTEKVRGKVIDWAHDNEHPKLRYFIACPWCVSPYLAVGVLAARTVAPKAWDRLARVLAASAVTGVLATLVER